MELIKLGTWYVEDMAENCEKIIYVTNQLAAFNIILLDKEKEISIDVLNRFMTNIIEVLSYWTRNTYVGHKKEASLRDAYQKFFTVLYTFILICQCVDNNEIKDFAHRALYHGILYRYLGHNTSENSDIRIEPEYNKLWVSWSKNKENPNVERKLVGSKTRITCHTNNKIYGIDLSAFNISCDNEEEVIYPTLADAIDKIEYLNI